MREGERKQGSMCVICAGWGKGGRRGGEGGRRGERVVVGEGGREEGGYEGGATFVRAKSIL